MTERSTPAAFLGAWRIDTMELWAKDAIELLGPGAFIFEDEAIGEFRFIAVRGWMDCRFDQRDGKPLVEFSWQGKDERDDASGRGWAVIDENETLEVISQMPPAFAGRSIPPGGVARRSNTGLYSRSSRLAGRAPRPARCSPAFVR